MAFVVIIVGAGPAGLAAEVYINDRYKEWAEREREKIPQRVLRPLETKIIEKTGVTASLWRTGIYDNLTLQATKESCALPCLDFDEDCPEYPRKSDFIKYLDEYETKLTNGPLYNTEVTKARYLEDRKKWEITTTHATEPKMFCDYLVVASGLNAVPRIPSNLPGLAVHFRSDEHVDPKDPRSPMKQIHSSKYKNGEIYRGKKVLVVGCGDSGIDICGDLRNYGATPYIVVNCRDRNVVNSVNERTENYGAIPYIVVNRKARSYVSGVNERTEKFYEDARVEGKINCPFEYNLSKLSKAVRNRGRCEKGNIDPKCSIMVNVCSDIESFGEKSVNLRGIEVPVDIDCVILATGFDHNVNKWLEGAEITFNETGRLQFDDALGDNIMGDKNSLKTRISAIGFDSNSGLHSLKTQAQEVYREIE